MPKQIHIGAGSLGLGFVSEFSHDLGFDLTIIHRYKENSEIINALSKSKEYLLRIGGSESRKIGFNEFVTYLVDELPILPENILDLFCDPDLLLITTAVYEDNLCDVGLLLACGIKCRIDKKLNNCLYIISCENIYRNSEILKTYVTGHLDTMNYSIDNSIIFPNTSVDRVCKKPSTNNGKITVEVENYRLWIIDNTYLDDKISRLLMHSNILLVDDLEPYYKRKLWLVNGLHIATAILGEESEPKSYIIGEVLKNRERLDFISNLSLELCEALRIDYEFDNEELNMYAKDIITRLKSDKKPTHDILRTLLFYDAIPKTQELFKQSQIRQIAESKSNTDSLGFSENIISFIGEYWNDKLSMENLQKFLDRAVLIFLNKLYSRLCEPAWKLISSDKGFQAVNLIYIIALSSIYMGKKLKEERHLLIEDG